MREEILDALRADPGSRTFGQLVQKRQTALLEILRLRRELEMVGWKQAVRAYKAPSAAPITGLQVPGQASKTSRPGSLLRLNEISAMLGMSRSTIYRRMQEGTFPQPVVLGARAVRWRFEVVEAWRDRLQERTDRSPGDPPRV
jgi:prophage regulatory protein